MKLNQKGAVDLVLTITLVIVMAVGGFVLWRVYDPSEDSSVTSSNTNQATISSYEECVAAGYPVMESYPEQCAVPDGETFVRQLSEEAVFAMNEQLVKYTDESLGFSIYLPADGVFATYLTHTISTTDLSTYNEPKYTRNLGGGCWITVNEDGLYRQYNGLTAVNDAVPDESDGLDIEGSFGDNQTRLCENVTESEKQVSALGAEYFATGNGDAGYSNSTATFQSGDTVVSISYSADIWGGGDANASSPLALSAEESTKMYQLIELSLSSLQIDN